MARAFLAARGFSAAEADTVWTAIALHTTPEVLYRMSPVIAATTAGAETDVLGLRLGELTTEEIDAVTAVHPRPLFKSEILQSLHRRVRRPAGDRLRHGERRCA